jgi:hypothetical protein
MGRQIARRTAEISVVLPPGFGLLRVLVVSKELAKDIGGDSRERRVSQAAIAAISGLMPTMFMTRVRL